MRIRIELGGNGHKPPRQKSPGQKTPGQKHPRTKIPPGKRPPGKKSPRAKDPGQKPPGQKTPGEKVPSADILYCSGSRQLNHSSFRLFIVFIFVVLFLWDYTVCSYAHGCYGCSSCRLITLYFYELINVINHLAVLKIFCTILFTSLVCIFPVVSIWT